MWSKHAIPSSPQATASPADVGRQGAMKPDDRAFGRNGMDGYIVGELDWSRVTALVVEVDFAERRRREGDPAPVRKQMVEEGFEAVLSRKQRATPAVARIFDSEKEAKLIGLACSKPPKGRARWTLRLLENKVVDRHCRSRQRQHDRADAKKNILQPHRRGD
jgi:hypothetical protein